MNSNIDRLSISLKRISNGQQLKIAASIVNQVLRILLFDPTQLTADQYLLTIDNIRTPASNSNGVLRIQYLRSYDQALVLQNSVATTATFLPFLPKINSEIFLIEQRYLDQGAYCNLKFSISMQNSSINSLSVIYVVFPIYYSPKITNDDTMLICLINSIITACQRDISYRLIVYNSPINIPIGETFYLTIQGIVAPSYD